MHYRFAGLSDEQVLKLANPLEGMARREPRQRTA